MSEHDEIEVLADGYSRSRNPDTARYRPLTPAEARGLRYGQRVPFKSKDGTVREVKVNGAVKTWKRDPNRLEVPVKFGLYECARFEAIGEKVASPSYPQDVYLLVRVGD